MKAGAVEFLTKPIDDQALLRAVDDAIGKCRNVFERQLNPRTLATAAPRSANANAKSWPW
jgi:FixJ family two-component response regulator